MSADITLQFPCHCVGWDACLLAKDTLTELWTDSELVVES